MSEKLKNAVYIGRVGLPNDAASIRVYQNSRILHRLGYDVEVISLNEYTGMLHQKAYDEWLKYHFINIRPKSRPGLIQKIGAALDIVFNICQFRKIKKYLEASNPELIILYNDLYFSSWLINHYCQKRGIKLVADVTEWYEKRPLQKNIAEYMIPRLTESRIRHIDPKIGNIIAISPYLTKFYLSQGCRVLTLPPIFDNNAPKEVKKFHYYHEYVVNFIYAGSPGNKDILMPFIESVAKVNSNGIKIRLDILGLEYSYLSSSRLKDTDTSAHGIFFHGKVKHEEVLCYLAKSDFCVLLRHNLRYAKAGFSTKLAECMMSGVAMFANDVGGAESVIENKIDGIIIDNANRQTIENALIEIYRTTESDLIKLRKKALEKALTLFHSDNYVDKFANFLNNM